MIANVLATARWHVRRRWRRLRSGARHRAQRRAAGMAGHMTWFECYSMALDAFDLALGPSGGEAERLLLRLFLPLNASEMTQVAVAMAMLGRPGLMDSHQHEDLELMKLQLAWIWTPEMER
ncbi:hypothetical protein EV645_3994 [Kribbella rubisoli]|uniref:Uncharacterized protein n=1 Tax=Kribbella rubisoli TaxID=3075929 RepID=A0A4Q7X379_9ACTN|nr:hypothetical protein [Kribbella rubisoli]RZU16429.1 hypothetical protein EV645_3994 [Kribbella rubisoli]